MGKIKRGILGGFTGKVANVVGSSWKGLAVMKSLPISVAYPNTMKQQKVKIKFKAGAELSGKVKMVNIRTLWNRWAVFMSGFNSFMRMAYNAMNDLGIVDLVKFKLSIGSYEAAVLDVAQCIYMRSQRALYLSSDWLTNAVAYNNDDIVYFALMQVGTNNLCMGDMTVNAGANSGTITFTDCGFLADTLVVTVLKNDGTLVSTSSNWEPTIQA